MHPASGCLPPPPGSTIMLPTFRTPIENHIVSPGFIVRCRRGGLSYSDHADSAQVTRRVACSTPVDQLVPSPGSVSWIETWDCSAEVSLLYQGVNHELTLRGFWSLLIDTCLSAIWLLGVVYHWLGLDQGSSLSGQDVCILRTLSLKDPPSVPLGFFAPAHPLDVSLCLLLQGLFVASPTGFERLLHTRASR